MTDLPPTAAEHPPGEAADQPLGEAALSSTGATARAPDGAIVSSPDGSTVSPSGEAAASSPAKPVLAVPPPATASQPRRRQVVLFDPRNVWKTGLVVLGVIALAIAALAFFRAASGLFFIVFMAWFVSLAMEPAVGRLATRLPRGVATMIVMLGIVVILGGFIVVFGSLVSSQLINLAEGAPHLVDNVLAWLEQNFGLTYTVDDFLGGLQGNVGGAADVATAIAHGVISALTWVLGAVGSALVFALMLFYLSADGPRLRRWIASFFPTRKQPAALKVWDTMAEKTGAYVAARLILAGVNTFLSGIVFAIVGLPYWLALALWTGLMAQLIPAIGTYISILVPALIGVVSPNPWLGLVVVVWGIIYQQFENYILEPRIGARAVEVHPAVCFASVVLGTTMFGVAGALAAIPFMAMALSLLEAYRRRYTLLDEIAEHPRDTAARLQAERRAARQARRAGRTAGL